MHCWYHVNTRLRDAVFTGNTHSQWKHLTPHHNKKLHKNSLSMWFLCRMQTAFITVPMLQQYICLLFISLLSGSSECISRLSVIPARSNLLCLSNLHSVFRENVSCLQLLQPFPYLLKKLLKTAEIKVFHICSKEIVLKKKKRFLNVLFVFSFHSRGTLTLNKFGWKQVKNCY